MINSFNISSTGSLQANLVIKNTSPVNRRVFRETSAHINYILAHFERYSVYKYKRTVEHVKLFNTTVQNYMKVEVLSI